MPSTTTSTEPDAHRYDDTIRSAALVAIHGLAGIPGRRPRRRGRRLGFGLDLGPPAGDLRPVGTAHPRGLDDAGRPGATDQARATRPDGRGEHVPQPGAHG